jgi:hypothetical protein
MAAIKLEPPTLPQRYTLAIVKQKRREQRVFDGMVNAGISVDLACWMLFMTVRNNFVTKSIECLLHYRWG